MQRQADLVVAHHPLPFRALKRLVTTNTTGRLLWQLVTHQIAVYSPHTAFDSAAAGINQRLAAGLGLQKIAPLVPIADAPPQIGAGRYGELPEPLSLRQLADRLLSFLEIQHLQHVGELAAPIQRVAVACGAAGEFLSAAQHAGCELLVLGETNLHTCLEAEATDVALLLPGHFASERFAVVRLAEELATRFPALEVWPSTQEQDPLSHYQLQF